MSKYITQNIFLLKSVADYVWTRSSVSTLKQKVGCEAYDEFGFSFWFQMY